MERDNITNQVNNFKRSLNDECYSFGDGRAMRTACNLYEDNLRMEKELDRYKLKLALHEKEIDRLQRIITNGIDEMSVNMISDSLSNILTP